ncbi:rhodanese-like domain-containing protein [Paenibacillus woosongensis]|uniref:Rhodanese-like domain-containing protein n=1 Tax=Paenibacillus woosongensis TaxID=307580 RepID=A0AA95L2J9_9BACL|nr:rhodanese-like domain-containing protein [Paenibacillus woosongensis]WHX49827.1 rhodanese-like domain-containing protein [Paenibacillus woosongensis]
MTGRVSKEISPQELSARLKKGEAVKMLDVREPEEWAAGHIEGAKHIPLGQVLERLRELDADEELIVICRSGNRSGLACELLEEKGFNVVNMTGGLLAWEDELV